MPAWAIYYTCIGALIIGFIAAPKMSRWPGRKRRDKGKHHRK